jgi:tRNA(Ile)-lysidine synthetase-like protein
VVEYGRVRFDAGLDAEPMPEPITVTDAGSVQFGAWEVHVAGPARVRSWQSGDRVRTSGGTKSLQDLFTDSKIPREQRKRIPVVEAAGQIVCVGDLVVADGFSARRLT